MRTNNGIRKICIKACNTVLLVLMLLLFVSMPASAATGSVEFVDMDTPDSTNTTIIEGNTVNVQVTLPSTYSATDPPFVAYQGPNLVSDSMITYTSTGATGSNRYLLTAGPGSATGTSTSSATNPQNVSSAQYDISPQFSATINEGTVIEETVGAQYSHAVESEDNIAITTHSTVTLQVTATETVQGVIQFSITGATGNFTRYLGGIATLRGDSLSDSREMTVSISKSGVETMLLTFDTAQRFEEDEVAADGTGTGIKAGTEFTITFEPPFVDPLILTVVTPQQAVEEVSKSIIADPTSPNVTDSNRIPFIDLKGDDTLSNITEETFSLLKVIERYNVPADNLDTAINIDWEWVPITVDSAGVETVVTDPNSPLFDVISISGGTKNTLNATVVPQIDDVQGYLQYTVRYKVPYDYSGVDTVTSTGTLKVNVRGTGIPPEITAISTTQGTPNDGPKVVLSHTDIPKSYDVFQGDRPGYTNAPREPYLLSTTITFGEKNSAADYAVIEASSKSGTPDAFSLTINGSGTPYRLGEQIENTNPEGQATFKVDFTAQKAGDVTYTIEYYKDRELMATEIVIGQLNVMDTTPSSDSSLAVFRVTSSQLTSDPDFADYEIGVTPVANATVILEVPYQVENIDLMAQVNDKNADRKIAVSMYVNSVQNPSFSPSTLTSGSATVNPIDVTGAIDDEYIMEFLVTAQDMSTSLYRVEIQRAPPSADTTLKTLAVYESDEDGAENLLPTFDPAVSNYDITVPHRREDVFIDYKETWPGADVTVVPGTGILDSLLYSRHKVDLIYDDSTTPVTNTTTVTLTVLAEDDVSKKVYTINITRLAPSNDATLTGFEFTDQAGVAIPFDDGQRFDAADRRYYITIPYSTESLKLKITPNDPYASAINALYMFGGSNKIVSENIEEDEELPILNIDMNVTATGLTPITMQVYVTAEDTDYETDPKYEVVITRLPPNTNTTLESLDVTDLENSTIPSFIFNKALVDYDDLNVNYLIDTVIITPVAESELSSISIDGTDLTEHKKSVTVELEASTPKLVSIIITAESGDTQEYLLHLFREPPDSDARLASLSVDGIEKLTPNFIPSTTLYSGMTVDGRNDIVITAAPVSEYATMRINGDGATAGTATPPIAMLYETQTVEVEVTAQDGRTKMVYLLEIDNPNLLPTSDDATLQNLLVQSGSMEPEFVPNLDTYKASVLPDVSYVNVIPVPTDPRAELEVKQGSKLLDELNGAYASSLQDGENEFTVTVTASDKSTTKEYTLVVYRNDEENAGANRPITAENIDFEGESPIVVDIRSYPVVSSDVFETLEEYPDKTIIFQGHDYSFSFNGADLTQNLPYAEYYDFGVSFSPPEVKDINALMLSLGNYSDPGYPVYIHFSQHTTLPATATFTMSLGTAYASRNLYWHYYNTDGDTDRIDYYGITPTNSRGTFSVPMDHFSTYIVYNKVVQGSENKADRFGSELLSGATGDKVNPNTSEKE